MKFYTWSMPEPALLLKEDKGHFMFGNGKWTPTHKLKDYLFGNDDFIDEISEAEARAKFPEAFN